MLALLRAAVVTVAETVSEHVWSTIPDDPAELPCVVVGLPELNPESETVFDARVDVYVLSSRTGGPGTEEELVTLTDVVLGAFGGSRGVQTGHDIEAGEVGLLAVDSARPTRLEVGGKQYAAYALTVATSLTSC
jgi:hypothetical protein